MLRALGEPVNELVTVNDPTPCECPCPLPVALVVKEGLEAEPLYLASPVPTGDKLDDPASQLVLRFTLPECV